MECKFWGPRDSFSLNFPGRKGRPAIFCKRFLNQEDLKILQATPDVHGTAKRPVAMHGPSSHKYCFSWRYCAKTFRGIGQFPLFWKSGKWWNINWRVNPSLYPANLASFLATAPCKSNSQVILQERSSSCMSPRLSVDGTWSGMQVSKADCGPSKWCTSRWLVESKPCGMEVDACERHSNDFKCLAAFHRFEWKIRSLIQWAK